MMNRSKIAAELLYDNPVVVREMRIRMRGQKAFFVMGAYTLLMFAVLMIAVHAIVGITMVFSAPLANRNLGSQLFQVMTWTQLILLSFIIPSLTAGALTTEIEKKTIEMLALTGIKPGRIVLGKQISGFLYSMMLLISSLPIAGICLMLGGLSPAEVAVTYLILTVWNFMIAAVGVFWSSLFKHTFIASLLAYGTAAGYLMLINYIGTVAFFPYCYSAGSGNDFFSLTGLCPGLAPMVGLSNAVVCGLNIPITLIAVVIYLALGCILLLTAVMHVKYFNTDKSLYIRLLMLSTTAFVAWLVVGDKYLSSTIASDPHVYSIVLASTILLFMGSMALLFATGPYKLDKTSNSVTYLFSARKLFKGDIGGAIPFMIAWTILLYMAAGGTFYWSAIVNAVTVSHSFWVSCLQVGVSIVAVVFGISAVGVMISAIVSSRITAVVLLILFLLMVFSGYGIVSIFYRPGISDTANPIWQLAAFWPFTPLVALSKTGISNFPKLWWPREMSWFIVSAVYFALGCVSMAVGAKSIRKIGGIKEE